MEKGWIKLPRSVRSSSLWPRDRAYTELEALFDLKMDAAYERRTMRRGGVMIHIPVGGVLTTQMHLADHWRWNRKTVRKFLNTLANERSVVIETKRGVDKGYTLITFLNLNDFLSSRDDPYPMEPEEIYPSKGTSANHNERSKESKLVEKVVMYGDPKGPSQQQLGGYTRGELVSEAAEMAEAAREGDYWELANDLTEAKQLMSMPRSALESVANVKTAFGKGAVVREFKRAAVSAEDDELKARLKELRRQKELVLNGIRSL
jgi:hypothetical protein